MQCQKQVSTDAQNTHLFVEDFVTLVDVCDISLFLVGTFPGKFGAFVNAAGI
jgi:hypothetical protein